ncbi:hypothetical protein JR316_0010759 [Psilocybe cubensis]|uniref:Uncharacterized protein n=1 Tax=Psilocybe cubensis TaxID=181762 RepID=A0ACB8GMG6_PSICU|nr:hypothetical protein JR316_0010759 [Psilocybe cubensis]KAH9476843.1 hypothetical protein JR316_0010759 [Psilocybe cubensis]
MNTTATNSTLTTSGYNISADHLHSTLGAAFFGFSAGAILFGITIRQAYQYYATSGTQDGIQRKLIVRMPLCSLCLISASANVGAVIVRLHLHGKSSFASEAASASDKTVSSSLLDTLHFVFSMYLVYNLILQFVGFAGSASKVLCPLHPRAPRTLRRAFGILHRPAYVGHKRLKLTNTFLTLSIPSHQLLPLADMAPCGDQQTIQQISSFSSGFEYVVYLGFGATAFIDCAIAAAMCLILHKSSAGVGERIDHKLRRDFMHKSGKYHIHILHLDKRTFVAQPDTLLYLGMEFSVTRLYANSVLAMFNARRRNNERMNKTIELKFPSAVLFGEPGTMSHTESLISDPFSPGQETKYSKCNQRCHDEDYSDLKGHHEKRISVSSRGYTV